MKQVPIFAICAILAALTTVGDVNTEHRADPSCSLASLKGDYGFSLTGMNVTHSLPFAFVGRASADGIGTLSGKGTQSRGGKILEGLFSGTYTVAPDCTGTVSFKFGSDTNQAALDFVLVDNGRQILFINLGDGTVETGAATMILPSH